MNLNLGLGRPYYRLRLTITTVVTFFLIVSTAPIVESGFSQSKSKGRQDASRPPGKVNQSTSRQSPDFDDEKWALFASEKLYYLTAKEAPELIEALNKSPEIDYQIENDL
jgi:hypothetical protein